MPAVRAGWDLAGQVNAWFVVIDEGLGRCVWCCNELQGRAALGLNGWVDVSEQRVENFGAGPVLPLLNVGAEVGFYGDEEGGGVGEVGVPGGWWCHSGILWRCLVAVMFNE